jgi:hypothetical protein
MGLLRRKPRVRHSARRTSRSPLAEREQRAYVLLEEARLRYERLLSMHSSDEARADCPDAHTLLHRELGMAGFCVSANIPSQRRRALVAVAHGRCGTGDERGGEQMYRIQGLVRRAWTAVEQGRGVPELSDPTQRAHAHLLAVQELFGVIALQAQRGSSRPAGLGRSAPSPAPTTKSPSPPFHAR